MALNIPFPEFKTTGGDKQDIEIYVVVQFFPLFKFYFPFFQIHYHALPYQKTEEN